MRDGPAQLAQKLIITTWPRNSDSRMFSPPSDFRTKSGASRPLRFEAAYNGRATAMAAVTARSKAVGRNAGKHAIPDGRPLTGGVTRAPRGCARHLSAG